MGLTETIEKTIDGYAEKRGMNPHSVTWKQVAVQLAIKVDELENKLARKKIKER